MRDRVVKPGMNPFELVRDGIVSLMKAIERFDDGKCFKPSTYAIWAIKNNLMRSGPTKANYFISWPRRMRFKL